jgi:hypothetical protein
MLDDDNFDHNEKNSTIYDHTEVSMGYSSVNSPLSELILEPEII